MKHTLLVYFVRFPQLKTASFPTPDSRSPEDMGQKTVAFISDRDFVSFMGWDGTFCLVRPRRCFLLQVLWRRRLTESEPSARGFVSLWHTSKGGSVMVNDNICPFVNRNWRFTSHSFTEKSPLTFSTGDWKNALLHVADGNYILESQLGPPGSKVVRYIVIIMYFNLDLLYAALLHHTHITLYSDQQLLAGYICFVQPFYFHLQRQNIKYNNAPCC